MTDADRCPKTVPPPRTPDGWTTAQLRSHPTYRYFLDPYARCELVDGHEGPHRNGGLSWHDPPLIVTAGAESQSLRRSCGHRFILSHGCPECRRVAELMRARRRQKYS